MKIECIRENLYKAINIAEHITGKKLALSILSKVLIETKDKNIFIKSTNLDLGIEIKVPGKVTGNDSIIISGTILENLLSNLPQQALVSLEKTNNNLLITSSGSTALITAEPSTDFPQIPKLDNKTKDKNDITSNINIDTQIFINGLKSVIYSASISDIKPELASISIKIEDGDMIFVATDSFRLAEKRVATKNSIIIPGHENGFLLPLKNATEVLRVFTDVKDDLKVSYNKNQVSFQIADIYMTSRVVDGVFPAYSGLIPKSFTTQAVILKNDLLASLRLASVFSDKFHQVIVKIIPDDSLFEIHSRNAESGESTVRVDGTIEGEALEISLNARYLTECFQSINKDSLTLGFNGRDKAILLRPVGDRSFLYLVMPLHQ
ncbi:MAG: DNA polymerase III subunit beta [Patescibacteria group bacterium]